MHALAAALVVAALHPLGGGSAAGRVSLKPAVGGTHAAVRVTGLAPRGTARVILQAGTCARPGASFALVAGLKADGAGAARAAGPIRFRASLGVPYATVADGGHVIRVVEGGRVVACGAVPRR